MQCKTLVDTHSSKLFLKNISWTVFSCNTLPHLQIINNNTLEVCLVLWRCASYFGGVTYFSTITLHNRAWGCRGFTLLSRRFATKGSTEASSLLLSYILLPARALQWWWYTFIESLVVLQGVAIKSGLAFLGLKCMQKFQKCFRPMFAWWLLGNNFFGK